MSLINLDTLREIKRSFAKFVAIILIVGLGVFVFSGLTVTGKSMRRTLDKFLNDASYEDILVNIPLGFEGRDYALVEGLDGLYEVEYGYDVETKIRDSSFLIRIFSLPKRIGMPLLTEGSFPKAKDEIVLGVDMKSEGYGIGDRIVFNREIDKFSLDDDREDALSIYEYKIVGFVKCLSYSEINESKGVSNRGLGTIKSYAFVFADNFKSSPTLAKLKFDDLRGIDSTSSEYAELVGSHRLDLDILFNHRPDEKFSDISADISSGISKGERGIDDARDRLDDASKQIQEGQSEYRDGLRLYSDNVSRFNRERSLGLDRLNASKKDLDDALMRINDGQRKIDENESKLVDAKVSLEEGKNRLKDGYLEYEKGSREYASGKKELELSREKIVSGEEELLKGRAKLDEARAKLQDAREKLVDGENEILVNEKKLSDGKLEYERGLNELSKALNMEGASLSDVKARIDILDRVLSNIPDDVLNGASLLEKLKDVDSAISDIQKEIEDLKIKRDGLDVNSQEYKELDEKIGLLTLTLNGLMENRDRLNALVSDFNNKVDEIKEKFPEFNVDDLSSIKSKLNDAKAGVKKLEEAHAKLLEGEKDLEIGKEKLKNGYVEFEEGLKTYEDGEREYEENRIKLDDGKRKLADGEKSLSIAKEKLDNGRRSLEESQFKYENGVNEYNENYEKFVEAKAKLKSGREKYDLGVSQYNEGKKEFEEKIETAKRELDSGRRKLYKAKNDLSKAKKDFNEQSIKADEKILDAYKKISDAKKVLNNLKLPVYEISSRFENPYLNNYLDNSHRIDRLSLLFPVFFFGVSLLVCYTTMVRMVEENRISIGTYKAMGYKNFEIAKKFFNYGASASLIGGVIGAFIGARTLPLLIGNSYYAGSIFQDNIAFKFYPLNMIIAISLGVIFTAVSAYLSVNKTLRERTSELLRQKAPSFVGNKRIFLERVPFVWNRLSFLKKVTARNLFRYKKRMFMTVVGILGCSALLVLGFGLRGSIEDVETLQFDEILNYSAQIVYDRDIDEDSYKDYRSFIDSKVLEKTHLYEESIKTSTKNLDADVLLMVPQDESYKDFIKIRNRKSKKIIELNDDGVVISEKLSKLKNLKVGDGIEFKDRENKVYRARVSEVCEMYIGHYMFMSPKYYEKVFNRDYRANMDLIKGNLSDDELTGLISKVSDYKSVLSAMDLNELRLMLNRYMFSLSKVELVITLASSLLAMVVLYNLTNINIEERIRELSTIKVLGFYSREVTAYIYRETWILTLIGVGLGLVFGKLLHYLILEVTLPDKAMLSPELKFRSFIISAFITIVISFIIMLIFHRKLKKVDMVASLKSNE